MIRRLLKIVNKEVKGLHSAAYLLGLFAVLSSLLALFRDRILAGQFGAGEILDVYYTSFRIPDILFFTIALMVSVFVLVPHLTRHNKEEESHELIGSVMLAFALTMFFVSVILYPFIPEILEWRFPDIFYGKYGSDLVVMSRIMLLQPILLGASNILASITQTYGRYVLYAIAPLLYNLGIILGVIFFYPYFGMRGLVYGVVLGAFAHMLLQIPFARSKGFLRLSSFKLRLTTTFKIVKISLPRTIGMSASHIAMFFLYSIASGISAGSVAILQLANNLQAAPLNIIGSSYSVAAFPALSRLFSAGKIDEFINHIVTALRHIIFWSFPLIALFIVLRAQIVRTVLGTGAFDWTDTRLTAAVLAMFILSLVLQGISLLLVRAYYAAGKTVKPFLVNVSSALFMLFFAYFLADFSEKNEVFKFFFDFLLRVDGLSGTRILMLPFAFVLSTALNVMLLFIFFSKDFGSIFGKLSDIVLHAFSSSVVLGIVTYYSLNFLSPLLDTEKAVGIFLQGAIAGIVGISAWVIVLMLMRNREISEVWLALHTRFWKIRAVSDIEPN